MGKHISCITRKWSRFGLWGGAGLGGRVNVYLMLPPVGTRFSDMRTLACLYRDPLEKVDPGNVLKVKKKCTVFCVKCSPKGSGKR